MSLAQTDLEQNSQILRAELKAWEKAFAAAHDGRKASRDEIKQDASIAAKYSEYNRVRDVLAGKTKPQNVGRSIHSSPSKKRKVAESSSASTPSRRKRRNVEGSPKRGQTQANLYNPTSPESDEGTPLKRSFVGPTPQKDGRVLGLFDLLGTDDEADTPSKAKTNHNHDDVTDTRQALTATSTNTQSIQEVAATPSKSRTLGAHQQPDVTATPTTSRRQHDRTPQSSARRFLLDRFVTPSKRAHDNDDETATPSATRSIQQLFGFSTPAFLKRGAAAAPGLAAVVEQDEEQGDEDGPGADLGVADALTSPAARRARAHPPAPRPGFFKRAWGRSLSSLLADVRKAEEDRMDEEMDLMDEMEHDGKPHDAAAGDGILGPDGAGQDSDKEETAPADGQRVWKKRGQKRQTKRVLMRPVKRVPRPAAATETGQKQDESEDEDDDNIDAVGETQLPDDEDDQDASDAAHTSGSESDKDDDSDAGGDNNRPKAKTDSSKQHKRDQKHKAAADGQAPSTDLEVVRKAAKKVNPAKHANFRRLKIRSKGSGKGRFGRRR